MTSYPPNSSKMYKLVETGTTQSSLGMVLISEDELTVTKSMIHGGARMLCAGVVVAFVMLL